jgi:hypothetical protein
MKLLNAITKTGSLFEAGFLESFKSEICVTADLVIVVTGFFLFQKQFFDVERANKFFSWF